MYKKIMILLCGVVFALNVVILQPLKPKALGWDTAAKLVLGQAAGQVIRGIAERIGMKLSGKALQGVEGYISQRAIQGDARAVNFIADVSSKTPSGVGHATGWKKWVLDPMLWISGADLIVEAYNAFKQGYEGQTPVPFTCYGLVNSHPGVFNPSVSSGMNPDNQSNITVIKFDGILQGVSKSDNFTFFNTNSTWNNLVNVITNVRLESGGSGYARLHYYFDAFFPDGSKHSYDSVMDFTTIPFTSAQSQQCTGIPTASQVPDVTNVDQSTINYFNTNTGNTTNITYNLQFETPDDLANDDTVPWNQPDIGLPAVFVPPDVNAPDDIKNLTETHDNTSVDLNWDNPLDSDFDHVNIYRGMQKIQDGFKGTSYHDSGLAVGSSQQYKITTVDAKGNESVGKVISVQLDDEPTDKPAGSSWWKWLLSPFTKILNLIVDAVKAVGSAIAGLAKAIADAVGAIFIPSSGFFDGYFTGLKGTFDGKIPIAGQLGDFFTTVKATSVNGDVPKFMITLPEKTYGGGTFSIIDFKYFTDYRLWILNFIRFTSWFLFLRRLYNRIPKMIY